LNDFIAGLTEEKAGSRLEISDNTYDFWLIRPE
jgi:hypothetical protein